MWKAEKEAFKGLTPWNEKDMEQITKLFLYLCDVKTVSDWRSIVCYQLIRLITWALQLRLGSVTCYLESNWIVACRYSNRKHLDQIGDKSLRCLCVCVGISSSVLYDIYLWQTLVMLLISQCTRRKNSITLIERVCECVCVLQLCTIICNAYMCVCVCTWPTGDGELRSCCLLWHVAWAHPVKGNLE